MTFFYIKVQFFPIPIMLNNSYIFKDYNFVDNSNY